MNIITDAIEDFIILALLCGIYGFTSDMMKKAGKAQKHGIMSYQTYTKQLLD
ncbi:MAG: hypothetical protein HRT44_10820 [Bdellovibrionales bacterium]|nr:hypothetical protein [Bdellovibrionales bacterium]NQZ19733.1 hypothetical protein [Bdellovibrionales bacterium]